MSGAAAKCVLVGDGAVGKTCLLRTLFKQPFPEEYFPLSKDGPSMITVEFDGEPCTLALYDTHGQEEHDRIRPIFYGETEVFLICFSVVHPPSLNAIGLKWIPEIRATCPRAYFIVVGLQTDLRDDPTTIESLARKKQKPVTEYFGKKTAKRLGAFKYVECSAFTKEGVDVVFQQAAAAVFSKIRGQCTII